MQNFKMMPWYYLRSLTMALIFVYVVARLLASPPYLTNLFAKPYGTYPQIVYRAYHASRSTKKTVMILGLSATKEALAAKAIAQAFPNYEVVNLGAPSSSGYALSLNLITYLLDQEGIRADAVILGLSSYFLDHGELESEATNATDFLTYTNARQFINSEKPYSRAMAQQRVVINELFPPARFARQLGRLIRLALYRLNTKIFTHPRPLEEFEQFYAELEARNPEFLFADRPKRALPATVAATFDSAKPNIPDPKAIANLNRAFQNVRHIAKQVDKTVIVYLPEPTFVRNSRRLEQEKAELRFLVRSAWPSGALIIDASAAVGDHDFYDAQHVAALGRASLTAEIIRALSPRL